MKKLKKCNEKTFDYDKLIWGWAVARHRWSLPALISSAQISFKFTIHYIFDASYYGWSTFFVTTPHHAPPGTGPKRNVRRYTAAAAAVTRDYVLLFSSLHIQLYGFI